MADKKQEIQHYIRRQTSELTKSPKNSIKWRFCNMIICLQILEGELAFKTPSKTTWIQKDELLFVSSGVLFSLLSVTQSTIYQLIEIDPSIFKGFAGDALYQEVTEGLLLRPELQYFKTNKSSFVGKRFQKWFKQIESADSSDENYIIECASLAIELVDMLSDIVKGKPPRSIRNTLAERNLADMIRFIEDNWAKPITVKDIGNAAGVKERQCLRIFQDYLNISPAQYLILRRLDEAAKLLSGSQIYTVVEISKKCGFVSSSYFIKLFKRTYGKTPSQYATETIVAKRPENPLEALSDFFG